MKYYTFFVTCFATDRCLTVFAFDAAGITLHVSRFTVFIDG